MIYPELKNYLQTNLAKPSLDFVWSDDDNRRFFVFIKEKYKNDFFDIEDNKQEVKRLFKEHFESIGYILFKLKDNQIRIKVFPYKIEPKDSINLLPIVELIHSNDNLIVYKYKDLDNQVALEYELKRKVCDFAYAISNEEINKKELIKFAVREALELKSNDIVIIKKEQIFIKLFNEIKRRKVSEEEKNTIANRYNGIDEVELEAFYKGTFIHEDNSDFFYLVAELFIQLYFIEKKISNEHYEKNVFPYVQAIITEKLIDSFDNNEEFFKGFSGYIFRIHFKELFDNITDLILAEIVASNNYMIDFLKYYSLNVIVINGEKYQVPALETEGGLKWNVISMLSVVKVYIKIDTSLKLLEKEIYQLEDEVYELYIGEQSPAEYHEQHVKKKETIEDLIEKETQKLNSYYDSLDISKSEGEKKNLERDINDIKKNMENLREKKRELSSKSIKMSVVKKYHELENNIDIKVRQHKREEKILSQNKEAYLSVKGALTKALMSKKKHL